MPIIAVTGMFLLVFVPFVGWVESWGTPDAPKPVECHETLKVKCPLVQP